MDWALIKTAPQDARHVLVVRHDGRRPYRVLWSGNPNMPWKPLPGYEFASHCPDEWLPHGVQSDIPIVRFIPKDDVFSPSGALPETQEGGK